MGLALGYGLGLRNQLAFGGVKLTPSIISKFIAWYKPSEQREAYYINQIGVQEREVLIDNGVSGIIHKGRAIKYDGVLAQYSRTAGDQPDIFKIYTGNLTFSFKIRMSVAPSNNSLIFGSFGLTTSGNTHSFVTTSGTISCAIRHQSGYIQVDSPANICDNSWHDISITLDKALNACVYIDNTLTATKSMVGFTFGNINSYFFIGNSMDYPYGVKVIRDFRIYSSSLSISDILKVSNGDYVSGCIAQYLCESGSESTLYALLDSVGSNHLRNINFNSDSLTSGPWPSMLNKYGYSNGPYDGVDLFQGDGNFTDSTKWTIPSPAGFDITGGVALFKDISTSWIISKRSISYTTSSTLKFTFEIKTGSGYIGLLNQDNNAILTAVNYTTGVHSIVFNPLLSGSQIRIYGSTSGLAYTLDNVTLTEYYDGILPPKIDSNNPTVNIFGNPLIFKDTAKSNLLKPSGGNVKFTDYEGNLFDATKLISVNDWYDATGMANTIAESAIAPYEFGRQYYNNGELIITKANDPLTGAEDDLVRKYLKISTPIQKSSAGIFLSFDDTQNSDNWLLADSVLNKYGWKATLAIKSDDADTTIQQATDYITSYKAKLLQLISAGHELTNHGFSHESFSAYTVTQGHTRQEYLDNIINSLTTIVHDVVGYDFTSFAYPSWFGRDSIMSNMILTDGYLSVRENTSSLDGLQLKDICYNGNSQILYALDIAPYTGLTYTDEEIIAMLDYARRNNLVINLLSHSPVMTWTHIGNITIDRLELICKYIVDNNMTFYRQSDLSPSIFN